MSWLFSQALVEAYSEEDSLGGAPCAQLNVMPSPQPFWRNDRTMDVSRFSQFGPTCAVLTADRGEAVLASYLADFPVRISASREPGMGSTASAAAFGEKLGASLAKFDPTSCGWKTRQRLLLEEGFESLETLPRWGMTVGGELWPLPTPSGLVALRASITSESGSGLPPRVPTPQAYSKGKSSSRPGLTPLDIAVRPELAKHALRARERRAGIKRAPTPTVQDSSNNGAPSQMVRNTKPLNAEVGGPLNPQWVEWLMGWPIGWTDLGASAMDSFRQWFRSHGASFQPAETDQINPQTSKVEL